MRNFKVGDKVRLCYQGVPFAWEIDDWSTKARLKLGDVYTVSGIMGNWGIKVSEDPREYTVSTDHFELVEEV